jgi:hypothetical protein
MSETTLMRMAGSWQCGRARLPTAPAAAPPSSCYGISPANPSHRRVGDDACHAPQRAPCPGCSGGELSGGTAPGGTVSGPARPSPPLDPLPHLSDPAPGRRHQPYRHGAAKIRRPCRRRGRMSAPAPPAGASRDSFRRAGQAASAVGSPGSACRTASATVHTNPLHPD